MFTKLITIPLQENPLDGFNVVDGPLTPIRTVTCHKVSSIRNMRWTKWKAHSVWCLTANILKVTVT